MEYENPQVPDEVNLPKSHPLADFSWMLLAVGGATVGVILILALLADSLVGYIPFKLEQRLATTFGLLEDHIPEHHGAGTGTPANAGDNANQEIQIYLQSLADTLIKQDPLPEGMSITVHYRDDGIVNAFATLGGHIIIHRGLVTRLESENALAMVMAHEIEHIRGRHPIRATGRGLIITLALFSITGYSDSSVLDSLVNYIGFFSTLSFSREHELQADKAALQLLQHHYGHVLGADQLFEVLKAEGDSEAFNTFLSTHPLHDVRIDAIKHFNGSDGTSRELVPLPRALGTH